MQHTSIVIDSNHSITHSALRFFSGTMLSRISGMLRDICMAYAFGTQSSVAALLVAFRFAHLLRRLLGEGAMQTALIPHFEELRGTDPQRAGSFFRDLSATLVHLLTIIILITMATLGGILKWGNLDSGNQEITWLTLLMMPSLLFICLFGINAALMQCEKQYFASSLAPAAFNLFWIIGIFFSSQYPPQEAMTILSLFITAACFAQWIVTLPSIYNIIKKFNIHNLWKESRGYTSDVLKLARPLALGIIGVGAAQINNALDAVFARWADTEGPAFLWYAIRIQQLPLALFGIAIANALLPPLSRAGKANDHKQFSHFLNFAIQRTLEFMIPITCALFLFADAGIQLVYGRGDFTTQSVVGTTLSLWGYGLGLIPMALILVMAPAFYSRGDYRTPSQSAVGSMVINIGLNTLLIAGLGLGAASIAVATSLSAWVNFVWLGFFLNRSHPWIAQIFSKDMMKVVLATAVAALGVWGLNLFLWGNFSAFSILQGIVPHYQLPFWEQAFYLGLNGIAFVSIYALCIFGRAKKD
jgi:putative peptidoglycan lipid II flippase